MAIERRDEATAWAAACRRAGSTGHLKPQTGRVESATQEVAQGLRTRIRPAGPKEASKLKVSRGSPLLDITRITYDDTGQPLHLLSRLVNPQRVHITDQRLPLTSP
ncbi:UTRA domain-containing protein [Nonomuraea sp. NPDC059194]|uniref:UTRA domain-containing protein n=1 Tax=Nonomuraea sp. NPDC059194 TaxID=3346764 RepID=UPI0036A27655